MPAVCEQELHNQILQILNKWVGKDKEDRVPFREYLFLDFSNITFSRFQSRIKLSNQTVLHCSGNFKIKKSQKRFSVPGIKSKTNFLNSPPWKRSCSLRLLHGPIPLMNFLTTNCWMILIGTKYFSLGRFF